MGDKKVDRRIRYTKLALRDALIELLQQKSIDRISVKELCEVADINRSTFYAHYADQYSLLYQIEQEVLNDINQYLDAAGFMIGKDNSAQVLIRVFDYVVENADLCKVLLGENGDIALQKDVMMLAQRYGMAQWQDKSSVDEVTKEYLYLFGVNGSIGVVQKWLQSGLKESTQDMANLITRMLYQGLSAFIGPPTST